MKRYLLVLLCFFVPLHAKQEWPFFKNEVIKTLKEIDPEVCPEKIDFMMDLIKDHKIKVALQLGVYKGATFFSLLWGMEYFGFGKCYGVDSWNVRGNGKYLHEDKIHDQEAYDRMFEDLKEKLKSQKHKIRIQLFQRDPLNALSYLPVKMEYELIDIDLNLRDKYALRIIDAYYHMLADNGYIILNRPNARNMRDALVYLLERAKIITPYVPGASFYVFQKKIKTEFLTKKLFFQ